MMQIRSMDLSTPMMIIILITLMIILTMKTSITKLTSILRSMKNYILNFFQIIHLLNLKTGL